jgi:16S rRNA (adenine1518-N6/adenine1519-N6)-dimethyltransferase
MKRKFSSPSRQAGPDLAPRKQLGQHFLRDERAIEAIVGTINSHRSALSSPHAHEIGPGEGILTRPLLAAGWNLTCVEKDPRSVELLTRDLLPSYPKSLDLVNADILRWDPPMTSSGERALCVGNIPYYITSDILLWLCSHRDHYSAAILMVQKEVADRLVARHQSKEYGRLSVRMQLLFSIRTVLTVPARAFFPPPKVDSAVIELRPTDFSFPTPEQDKQFERFTATLFSARRKMLRRGLALFLETHLPSQELQEQFWSYASSLDVQPETRPDAIAPSTILALHQFVWENRLHD